MVTELALHIPEVRFPLDVTGGPAKFQRKRLELGILELTIDQALIARELRRVAARLPELTDLKVHLRPGHLECEAYLPAPKPVPVTFKIAFDGDGERLAVYVYDVRLYAFASFPAPRLAVLLVQAFSLGGILPEIERRGTSGFTTRILPDIVQRTVVSYGYKVPLVDSARLAEASVTTQGLKLRFTAGALPPPAAPDEELMYTLEGARAFAGPEELLAQNHIDEARNAYLSVGARGEAHPFAAERLLTLLVADPMNQDLALDIASSLERRLGRSATALWVEASVRLRQGEHVRAAERYLALCDLSRRSADDAAAAFAAEAAADAAVAGDAPHLAVRALQELLGLKPDHLPALRELARASTRIGDRSGAMRAYRRLSALARDANEAANAHVQMARLGASLETDAGAARLQAAAALRLAPDHPEALELLAELCFRSGEHLRAIKLVDRLHFVALANHDVGRASRATLLGGIIWEEGFQNYENARLRYREAAQLSPNEAAPHLRLGRVAERSEQWQEAFSSYQQAIELAATTPHVPEARGYARDAHHALARLTKARLGDEARAFWHFEQALALDPGDEVALAALLPYLRAQDAKERIAKLCEQAAAVVEEPTRRAKLLVEAADVRATYLGEPEAAEKLFLRALDFDGKNRQAMLGLLALGEERKDAALLGRVLKGLVQTAENPTERSSYLRRLAVVARDVALDLNVAAEAYRELANYSPDDLHVLGELISVERRRQDWTGLLWALQQRARVSENRGETRMAAAALRELGQILDQRLGRASEAVVALERSARLFPNPDTMMDLAAMSARSESPERTRELLETALDLLKDEAPKEKLAALQVQLGRACELAGDAQAARQHYTSAFSERRLDDELFERLEALTIEQHLTAELVTIWRERAEALLEAGRGAVAAPLFLRAGKSCVDAGDSDTAIQLFEEGLKVSASNVVSSDILEALVVLERARLRPREAAEYQAKRAKLLQGHEAAVAFTEAAVALGDPARELELLTAAIQQQKDYPQALLRRAALLTPTDSRRALADYRVVFEETGEEPTGDELVRAAAVARGEGELTLAREWLQRHLKHSPASPDVALELARLYGDANNRPKQTEVLLEIYPRLEGARRDETLRELVAGLRELRRDKEARELLRGAVHIHEGGRWALEQLFELSESSPGTAMEREALLEELLQYTAGVEQVPWLLRRAELYAERGNFSAAQSDFAAASALAPNAMEVTEKLARAARAAGASEVELAALAKLLPAPSALERLRALAPTCLASGQRDLAYQAFELLGKSESEPTARHQALRGLASAASGDAQALAALRAAAEVGTASLRLEASVAIAERLAEEPHRAADAWRAVLALSPRHAPALHNLAELLRRQEDHEGLASVLTTLGGIATGEEAVRIQEELAELYLAILHKPELAEVALRRLIELQPSNADPRERLADLLVSEGRRGEALETLLATRSLQLPKPRVAGILRRAAGLAREEGDAAIPLELDLLREAESIAPLEGDDLTRLVELLLRDGSATTDLRLLVALTKRSSFKDAPEASEEAYLRLASIAQRQGAAALAEEVLTALLKARPQSAAAVEAFAALREASDPRGALTLRARFLLEWGSAKTANAEMRRLGKKLWEEFGDRDLARPLLRKALEQKAERLETLRILVEVVRGTESVKEHTDALEQLAEAELEAGNRARAAAALMESAELALATDDKVSAERVLAQAVEHVDGATAAELWLKRVQLRVEDGDVTTALEFGERAWEASPTAEVAEPMWALAHGNPDAEPRWQERRTSFLDLKERSKVLLEWAKENLAASPEQALATLREVRRLAPGTPEVDRLYDKLLFETGAYEEYVGSLEERAVEEADKAVRAGLLQRAATVAMDKLKDQRRAVEFLWEASNADPGASQVIADRLMRLDRSLAAELDARVLAENPLDPCFDRHAKWLASAGSDHELGRLWEARATETRGLECAEAWLQAHAAYRRARDDTAASRSAQAAFQADQTHELAFETALEDMRNDEQRTAQLLQQRAAVASTSDAREHLRRRAEILSGSDTAFAAAAAWDDYLAYAPDDLAALQLRADLAANSGGPRAAMPFDRALLERGREALPLAIRAGALLRIGHGSMDANAYRDAAASFMEVVRLPVATVMHLEALQGAQEAYTRLGNYEGQFRVGLLLVAEASGDEAVALYQRLSEMPVAGALRLPALRWLALHSPSNFTAHQRLVEVLEAEGLHAEVFAEHERFAAVAEPDSAMAAFFSAARVALALQDSVRARDYGLRALSIGGLSEAALEILVDEGKRSGIPELVEGGLARRLELTQDPHSAKILRVELATAVGRRKGSDAAQQVLEPLLSEKPPSAGAVLALGALEDLAQATGDLRNVATARERAVDHLRGRKAVEKRFSAAVAWMEADDPERAVKAFIAARKIEPDTVQEQLKLFEIQDPTSAELLVAAVGRADDLRNRPVAPPPSPPHAAKSASVPEVPKASGPPNKAQLLGGSMLAKGEDLETKLPTGTRPGAREPDQLEAILPEGDSREPWQFSFGGASSSSQVLPDPKLAKFVLPPRRKTGVAANESKSTSRPKSFVAEKSSITAKPAAEKSSPSKVASKPAVVEETLAKQAVASESVAKVAVAAPPVAAPPAAPPVAAEPVEAQPPASSPIAAQPDAIAAAAEPLASESVAAPPPAAQSSVSAVKPRAEQAPVEAVLPPQDAPKLEPAPVPVPPEPNLSEPAPTEQGVLEEAPKKRASPSSISVRKSAVSKAPAELASPEPVASEPAASKTPSAVSKQPETSQPETQKAESAHKPESKRAAPPVMDPLEEAFAKEELQEKAPQGHSSLSSFVTKKSGVQRAPVEHTVPTTLRLGTHPSAAQKPAAPETPLQEPLQPASLQPSTPSIDPLEAALAQHGLLGDTPKKRSSPSAISHQKPVVEQAPAEKPPPAESKVVPPEPVPPAEVRAESASPAEALFDDFSSEELELSEAPSPQEAVVPPPKSTLEELHSEKDLYAQALFGDLTPLEAAPKVAAQESPTLQSKLQTDTLKDLPTDKASDAKASYAKALFGDLTPRDSPPREAVSRKALVDPGPPPDPLNITPSIQAVYAKELLGEALRGSAVKPAPEEAGSADATLRFGSDQAEPMPLDEPITGTPIAPSAADGDEATNDGTLEVVSLTAATPPPMAVLQSPSQAPPAPLPPDELVLAAEQELSLGDTSSAASLIQSIDAQGNARPSVIRRLASKLAASGTSAGVAMPLLVRHLKKLPGDIEAWKGLADALTALGRNSEAQRAQGFVGGLTPDGPKATPSKARSLPGVVSSSLGVPKNISPLDADTMPRLAQATHNILQAFGASGVLPVLELGGGCWVYLAGKTLVIGAGTLQVLSPGELPIAVALALRMGEASYELGRTEEPPGLSRALLEAIHAYPSTHAACRILGVFTALSKQVPTNGVAVINALVGAKAFAELVASELERIEARTAAGP